MHEDRDVESRRSLPDRIELGVIDLETRPVRLLVGETETLGDLAKPKRSGFDVGFELRSSPLPPRSVVFGEVGLAGEIRPVQRGLDRIREAAKLGFATALVPLANQPKQAIEGIDVVPVARVSDALDWLRG